MKSNLDELIFRLSRHSTNCGYLYLKRAVELVVDRGEFPRRRLTSGLYAQVAEDFGKTVSQVSRSIGRAAEDIWNNGGGEVLSKLLHKPLPERPTPGDLIYYIALIASGEKVRLL